jgi:hypothetical protein
MLNLSCPSLAFQGWLQGEKCREKYVKAKKMQNGGRDESFSSPLGKLNFGHLQAQERSQSF